VTALPPPTQPMQPPKRDRRRQWFIVAAVVGSLGALSVIGAVLNDGARARVATADPGQPSSGDADIDIAAIDLAWSVRMHDVTCALWNDVKNLPNIDDFVISKFEEGYDQKLTAEGRAHLIDLIHSC